MSAPFCVGSLPVFSHTTMGATSLVLSLFIHILLLPFFTLVIFAIRFIPPLATLYYQLFARNHFAWLSPDPVPFDLCAGLPVSRYTRKLGVVECVVCLCDIDEGEEIRVLSCKHLFHKACLDRWLGFGRGTCPMCRDCVLPSETKAKLAEMHDESITESTVDFVAAFVHGGWWG